MSNYALPIKSALPRPEKSVDRANRLLHETVLLYNLKRAKVLKESPRKHGIKLIVHIAERRLDINSMSALDGDLVSVEARDDGHGQKISVVAPVEQVWFDILITDKETDIEEVNFDPVKGMTVGKLKG